MYMSPVHATQKFNKMLVHPAFPSSLSLVLVMCISLRRKLLNLGSQASKDLHCAPFLFPKTQDAHILNITFPHFEYNFSHWNNNWKQKSAYFSVELFCHISTIVISYLVVLVVISKRVSPNLRRAPKVPFQIHVHLQLLSWNCVSYLHAYCHHLLS